MGSTPFIPDTIEALMPTDRVELRAFTDTALAFTERHATEVIHRERSATIYLGDEDGHLIEISDNRLEDARRVEAHLYIRDGVSPNMFGYTSVCGITYASSGRHQLAGPRNPETDIPAFVSGGSALDEIAAGILENLRLATDANSIIKEAGKLALHDAPRAELEELPYTDGDDDMEATNVPQGTVLSGSEAAAYMVEGAIFDSICTLVTNGLDNVIEPTNQESVVVRELKKTNVNGTTVQIEQSHFHHPNIPNDDVFERWEGIAKTEITIVKDALEVTITIPQGRDDTPFISVVDCDELEKRIEDRMKRGWDNPEGITWSGALALSSESYDPIAAKRLAIKYEELLNVDRTPTADKLALAASLLDELDTAALVGLS